MVWIHPETLPVFLKIHGRLFSFRC